MQKETYQLAINQVVKNSLHIIPGPPLRYIYNLKSKQIDDKDLEEVVKIINYTIKLCEQPVDLQLNLCKNKIGDLGCAYLSKNIGINLKVLVLELNQIRDKGCQKLAKANWPYLHQLQLASNNISEKGFEHISKAFWPKMSQLWLQLNPNNMQSFYFINKKYKHCHIESNWSYL